MRDFYLCFPAILTNTLVPQLGLSSILQNQLGVALDALTVTPLPLVGAWRSPAEITAASTTTSPWCWISINLSFPLLDQEGGEVFPTVRVLNAEVPSVRHLVIGDLDHDEYDSINPVLLNASARDLQAYVDALPSPSLLDDSID